MNNLPPDWLTNPPDWLFSHVATVWEAVIVGTAVAIGGGLAKDVISHAVKRTWNHREQIMQKLRTEPPRTIRITVTDSIGLRDSVWGTVVPLVGVPSDELVGSLVGSERTVLWNVEAPAQPLARRLEELVAWYFHVS